MMRRLFIALTSFLLIAAPLLAQPAGQTEPSQLDGFVPLDQLPPGEQMPAAPLLIAAYAFFLVLMMVYLWTIWNRLSKVEKELQELARRHGGAAR
jgi:hypothetical protein